MHSLSIQKVIDPLLSVFYYIGFWHSGDKPTPRAFTAKLFYCAYYALFVVSLVVGAIVSEKRDYTIFLTETSIAIVVLYIKLWVLLWKQNQILDLLNRICVFSVRYDDDLVLIREKLKRFLKFVIVFCIVLSAVCVDQLVLPFIVSEPTLLLEIGFPLDYKNSENAFWIASVFLLTEIVITVLTVFGSIILWFLLLSCSLRYEGLGSELTKMGRISEDRKRKTSEKKKHNHFFQDLKAIVDAHLHIRELTNSLDSFFSYIFVIQFATSGLCICGSVYCLAFNFGDNAFESCVYVIQLFYFTSDLFMITYFGNEIKLSTDRLSYCLFKSDWIGQPQATKKCLIIFGEYLKQAQVLLIGKVYPLTLETFTKILNSAYSMFNILKTFQK